MKNILFAVISFFIFVSCGNDSDDRNVFRLGAMSSMDYIPYVLAEKLGYYDSLGIDVEIVKFFSANDRDAALQSGNIDGTVIDFTGAVMQHAKGMNLKLIAEHDGIFSLIASKTSGIISVNDLKGRKIAVSRNTVIEFAVDAALASAGISSDEVEKPEVNKIPVRLELLRNGAIDATLFPDPFTTIALFDGHRLLLTTVDMGIYVTGTVVRDEVLNTKYEVVKKMLEGYNMAVRYMNENMPDKWNNVLVSDAGFREELLKNVKLPHFKPLSTPKTDDLKETVRWLKEKNLISDEYNADKLIYDFFRMND